MPDPLVVAGVAVLGAFVAVVSYVKLVDAPRRRKALRAYANSRGFLFNSSPTLSRIEGQLGGDFLSGGRWKVTTAIEGEVDGLRFVAYLAERGTGSGDTYEGKCRIEWTDPEFADDVAVAEELLAELRGHGLRQGLKNEYEGRGTLVIGRGSTLALWSPSSADEFITETGGVARALFTAARSLSSQPPHTHSDWPVGL